MAEGIVKNPAAATAEANAAKAKALVVEAAEYAKQSAQSGDKVLPWRSIKAADVHRRIRSARPLLQPTHGPLAMMTLAEWTFECPLR
jgi:hypothetical protein